MSGYDGKNVARPGAFEKQCRFGIAGCRTGLGRAADGISILYA
jgi:hypothetical protein